MRKIVFPFLFLTFSVGIGNLFAQNTFPLPNTFPLRPGNYNPSITNLVKFPSNLVLRSSDLAIQTYPINYGNAVDSIYFPTASWTSLEGETRYIFKVDSFGRYGSTTSDSSSGLDTLVFMTVRKITYRLDSTAFKKVWLNRSNRQVVDSIGFTFNRTNISNKDEFEVDLTYDKVVMADSAGRLLVDVGVIDSISNTLVTTDFSQHKIYEELSFFVSDTGACGIVSDQLNFLLIIPDTNFRVHLSAIGTLSYGGSGEQTVPATGYFAIYEEASAVGGSDTLTVFNQDRNSTGTSSIIVTKVSAPYITSRGTNILLENFGDNFPAGGVAKVEDRFILKNNTKYVISIFNSSVEAVAGIKLGWFEHVNH